MVFRKSLTAGSLAIAIALAVFFSRGFAVEQSLNSLDQAMNRLVFNASQSVVTVEVTTSSSQVISGLGGNPALVSLVSSGLIIDTNGNILVAAQTVKGRNHIKVEYEHRAYDATLVATDFQTGLAILTTGFSFGQPVQLADDYACAGQMIVSIASSHGIRACATIGFCAGVREDGGLQFSVPLVSGSIGGGVFDLSGKLVGMVCGAVGEARDGEAGIAVPGYQIASSVKYMMTHGDRKAGFLGVTTMESEISPSLHLSRSNWLASAAEPSTQVFDRGIVITNMISSSPAMLAGLKTGDVIFRVDGKAVVNQWDLKNLIRSVAPGRFVTVDFLRDSAPRSVRVQIAESNWLPWDEPRPPELHRQPQPLSHDSLALEIERLKQSVRSLESRLQVTPK